MEQMDFDKLSTSEKSNAALDIILFFYKNRIRITTDSSAL